jgi:hypothetical protein
MAKKKPTPKKTIAAVRGFCATKWRQLQGRVRGLLMRRPHRSFRRTLRRDYSRSLKLPGYWSFTNYVRRTLLQQKKLFLGVAVFYGVMIVLLVGVASQDSYLNLSEALRETSGELFKGGWGEIGKAMLLLASGMTGSFSAELTESQLIYVTFVALLAWLTSVWLLRAILGGAKPKFRDGLYSAGSPIVATLLVLLVLVVQLLPVAIAIIGFGSAVATELIQGGGVEAMVIWVAIGLLILLSLYLATSTLLALVIVTLPGMYPMQALKIAGDVVIGRRIRILLRLLWLGLTIALGWVAIMVPVVLLDTWAKAVFPATSWVPVVPVIMLIMSSATIVWSASYVYLLYRKVVDDDAAPA